MNIEELKVILKKLLKIEVKGETARSIEFVVLDKYSTKISKSKLITILNRIDSYSNKDETELFSDTTYEIAVFTDTLRFLNDKSTSKKIEIKDSESNTEYILGLPSDEYIIFILSQLNAITDSQNIKNGIMFGFRIRRLFEREETVNLLQVLKCAFPRLASLQIKSTSILKVSEYENLAFSFFFNYSYNLDSFISPIRSIDEISNNIRIKSLRRGGLNELEPPRRIYNNDLVLHYQKGISSDSSDHKYISFYHVIEHFFEKIYNEDIVNEIRNHITTPSFSYRKDKNIKDLVTLIKKRLKYKNDEFYINELEALELTLRRYVDLDELKLELEAYESSIIEYFRSNEVSFSKGNRVNFNSGTDECYKNLANRIYKNRNSIVHSKENEKNKFVPFRDEKILSRELIILRLVVEKIIINSSELNNIN